MNLRNEEKGPVENHDRRLEGPLGDEDDEVVVAELAPHLPVHTAHLTNLLITENAKLLSV